VFPKRFGKSWRVTKTFSGMPLLLPKTFRLSSPSFDNYPYGFGVLVGGAGGGLTGVLVGGGLGFDLGVGVAGG
jgi:hypothetical protein